MLWPIEEIEGRDWTHTHVPMKCCLCIPLYLMAYFPSVQHAMPSASLRATDAGTSRHCLTLCQSDMTLYMPPICFLSYFDALRLTSCFSVCVVKLFRPDDPLERDALACLQRHPRPQQPRERQGARVRQQEAAGNLRMLIGEKAPTGQPRA